MADTGIDDMIWSKTDAGRAEMQTRALVKERVRRNLLLLIDGVRTEASLMASIDGVTEADLDALAGLGLIALSAGFDATSASSTAPAPPAAGPRDGE